MLLDYTWYDLIGTLGVILIIITYFLLMIRKISSTTITYSAMNALGAIFILISLSNSFNLAAFLIEVFWLLISLAGIVLAIHTKLKSHNNQ